MNNHAVHAFVTPPNNPLDATPPGSPAATPTAAPNGSPHTPTGAAHAILQAAAPPPIHGHHQNAFQVGSPTVHTHTLWATPAWINGAAIGANMLNLTPLAHPAFLNDVPPQQAGGGLGDLAAFFPALAPVNTHLPGLVMAPGTPLVDAAGNITEGLAHPFQTPSPQERVPATPRAGGRANPFRGNLLPVFDRISRRDAQEAADRQWQIANAHIMPQTPPPAGDVPPVFTSPDPVAAPVVSPAAQTSASAEASLPGQPGPAPSAPGPDEAGPSNWWQR